jgi:hypothetical protein
MKKKQEGKILGCRIGSGAIGMVGGENRRPINLEGPVGGVEFLSLNCTNWGQGSIE